MMAALQLVAFGDVDCDRGLHEACVVVRLGWDVVIREKLLDHSQSGKLPLCAKANCPLSCRKG